MILKIISLLLYPIDVYKRQSLIKVPSACNLNKRLLEYLCDNYEGEIHLSFGMTLREEEENIVSFFENKGRNKDLVIYARCV